MKSRFSIKKTILAAIAVCLCTGLFVLSGCSFNITDIPYTGSSSNSSSSQSSSSSDSSAVKSDLKVTGSEVNAIGELIVYLSDGSTQNLGAVAARGDGTTDITINTSGSDIVAATTKGLLSAVSVFCTFTYTYQTSSGGWFPGSSNSGSTQTEKYSTAGAGVIYSIDKTSGDALIITNYHVVYSTDSDTANKISDDIIIYLYGSEIEGREIKATYVGGSMYYDIAVLRVENNEFIKSSIAMAATIGNSDEVAVGETAIAIGNPEAKGTSATYGVIGVASENLKMTAADDTTTVTFRVIRIDTSVNHGNSGGGLYNSKGELIGIVNARSEADGVDGFGYALPSAVVKAIVGNILDYCLDKDCESVQRVIMGITVKPVDCVAFIENGVLGIRDTVEISEISSTSVMKGKLAVGDVVKSIVIGGKTTEIIRQYQLIDSMLDARVGDVIKINVTRQGEELSYEFTVTESLLVAY